MCIKLVNCSSEVPYDIERPLEEQLVGCQQIVVNYEPFDKAVDKFLSEVQRFARTGVSANLNVKVIHNNNIAGFKVKRNIKKATNDITLNEIIRLMVLSQIELDKKLENLANVFAGMAK